METNRMTTFIRLFITVALTVMAARETGPFTGIALFCLFAANELTTVVCKSLRRDLNGMFEGTLEGLEGLLGHRRVLPDYPDPPPPPPPRPGKHVVKESEEVKDDD